jgi:hypothetical protein
MTIFTGNYQLYRAAEKQLSKLWAACSETAQLMPSLVGAAAISGLPADVFAFPFSRVKTVRMTQGAFGKQQGFFATTRNIYRLQGLRGFYRGLSPVLTTAIPGTTAYFTGAHLTERALGTGAASSFAQGLAGQLAGSAVWVPSEVLKELRQMMNMKPELRGKTTPQLLRHIVRHEGVRGLYRGFVPQLLTFGPFNSLGVLLSTQLKQRVFGNQDNVAASFTSFLFGFGIAAAVTTPIDVVKTRIQVSTADPKRFPYRGIYECIKHVLEKEGLRAFLSGGLERALWLGQRQAIAWTTFGTAFSLLRNRPEQPDEPAQSTTMKAD